MPIASFLSMENPFGQLVLSEQIHLKLNVTALGSKVIRSDRTSCPKGFSIERKLTLCMTKNILDLLIFWHTRTLYDLSFAQGVSPLPLQGERVTVYCRETRILEYE